MKIMKKLTLLTMMLSASIVFNLVHAQCSGDVTIMDGDAVVLPVVNAWGDASGEYVANPAGSGNSLVQHLGAGEFGFAGMTIQLDAKTVGLSCNTVITLDVYADTVGDLLVQVGNSYGTYSSIEVLVPVTVAGSWTTVTADFASANKSWPESGPADAEQIASLRYDQISLFARSGEAATGDWYFDNMVGETADLPESTISTLSGITVNGVALENFAEAVFSYTFPLSAGSVTPTVVATPKISGATATVESSGVSTPSDVQIQVVSADLSDTSIYAIWFVDYNRLPLDFEKGTYAMEGFDGGSFVYDVENELTGSHNTVSKLVKGVGAPWAGGAIFLTTPLDSANNGFVFTVDVKSPRAGDTILFKIENPADYNNNIYATAYTTVAGAWETLTFDFTPSIGANGALLDNMSKVVFIPNSLSPGDGSADWTYYIDNVYQVNCTVDCDPAVPGGGDCSNNCPTDVDGNGVTGVTDLSEVYGEFGNSCP
jgi:hypothetical protein